MHIHAKWEIGLFQYFQGDKREKELSLCHRSARTLFSLACYFGLLLAMAKGIAKFPVTAWWNFEATQNLLLACVGMFLWLVLPLAICILLRRILNPIGFFPIAAILIIGSGFVIFC